MPGTTWPGWNATCSVSAKKFSGLRSRTIRPSGCKRHHFLRDQLGRIEHVEGKLRRRLVVERLDRELELGEVAHRDRIVQIATLGIRISAVELHRLVPDEGGGADPGAPVKLDERRRAAGIDETKRVNSEPFHHPQRTRQRAIGHRPEDHVKALGHQRDEVPERVVRARRLRISPVGLHLDGVNEVGKLDRVLDEEHGDVVADEVEVSLLGVELHGKPPDITRRIP